MLVALFMSPATLTSRPVRSSSREKIARILAAARARFTGAGYEATSMDAIAAEACVSKATVYAHFRSKPELFAAVITDEGDQHLVPLAAGVHESLESVLRRFGREASELVLAPSTTAIFRVIAAERSRFPELGKLFFEAGPARIQGELADYFTGAMERGEIRRERPQTAAIQFLALMLGDLQVRELLGTEVAADLPRMREITLEAGIDCFLRAYRLPAAKGFRRS